MPLFHFLRWFQENRRRIGVVKSYISGSDGYELPKMTIVYREEVNSCNDPPRHYDIANSKMWHFNFT